MITQTLNSSFYAVFGIFPNTVDKLIPSSEHHLIDEAVREAEKKTSSRIRFLALGCVDKDVKSFSQQVARDFVLLRMNETSLRNSVLIAVLVTEERRAFVICPDEGVLAKHPQSYWDNLTSNFKGNFSKYPTYTPGIVAIINEVGRVLASDGMFPRTVADADKVRNTTSLEK